MVAGELLMTMTCEEFDVQQHSLRGLPSAMM
jgi:hypothetical protein